jgi:hypothetical protein
MPNHYAFVEIDGRMIALPVRQGWAGWVVEALAWAIVAAVGIGAYRLWRLVFG